MKLVPLTRGAFAVVDDDDFERVAAHKWSVSEGKQNLYAQARVDGERVLMHRWLLDAPKGYEVDHANGMSLDNRRENLKVCTRTENLQNRPRYAKRASEETPA